VATIANAAQNRDMVHDASAVPQHPVYRDGETGDKRSCGSAPCSKRSTNRNVWLACSAILCGSCGDDADSVRERLRYAYCAQLPLTATEVRGSIVKAQALDDMTGAVPQERGRLCAAMLFELTAGEGSLRLAEARAASLALARAEGVDVAQSGATVNLHSTEWRIATREVRDACLRADRATVGRSLRELDGRTNERLVEAQRTCAASGFTTPAPSR